MKKKVKTKIVIAIKSLLKNIQKYIKTEKNINQLRSLDITLCDILFQVSEEIHSRDDSTKKKYEDEAAKEVVAKGDDVFVLYDYGCNSLLGLYINKEDAEKDYEKLQWDYCLMSIYQMRLE